MNLVEHEYTLPTRPGQQFGLAVPVHETPHEPQFGDRTTCVSHPLACMRSQSPNPARQVIMHVPPNTHVAVAFANGPHVRPHAPQLVIVESDASHPSLAARLQSEKPAAHTNPHTPDPHVGVAFGTVEQMFAQRPQLLGSMFAFTHPVAHAVSPAGQSNVQRPSTHTCPVMHGLKHRPQCIG